MSCYTSCRPSCVIPSCIQPVSSSSSYPISGLGSLGSCSSPCGGLSSYSGGISSYGGAAQASSLGILSGASVGCVTQTPPSEIVIEPSPIVVVLPGPILSSTCNPVRVGGYTACSSSGSSGGYLSSGSGYLGSRRLSCHPCS